MKRSRVVLPFMGRWLALLLGIVATLWSVAARAETRLQVDSLCHAVTDRQQPDEILASLRFACDGTPAGYQQGSLWLRVNLDRLPVGPRDVVLMVHQSRFDRLAVAFSYSDGTVAWRQVRGGDFHGHWRPGGQIEFEAPGRAARLTAVTMRYDGLAAHGLLNMRLLSPDESGMQSAGLAVAIGAALTLLLISGLYNLSLAHALRRQYLAWQGGWAMCMLAWGAVWSQIHLLVLPGMAGTLSAQTATFLSCLAIALATISAVTALGRDTLPAWLRLGTLGLGISIGIIGVPASLMRGVGLQQLGTILGVATLADLLAVAICLGVAWRRGCAEARDFALAWSLPMITLALIHLVDVENAFWGGGSKVPVLFAAAWQTIWLSVATTRSLASLRLERDRARMAAAQAGELARRDPLTGLRNRRGFVETAGPMLDHAGTTRTPIALLLIDIDRFKAINDVYGHEAGDMVLTAIARRIERWEGAMCTAARLGGEEFALLIAGLEGFALARFAESVRQEIAACDHRDAIGDRCVTASIGVAATSTPSDFRQLYRLADEALYEAKRSGRDRVASRRFPDDQLSLPDVAGPTQSPPRQSKGC
ncbi:sensor domain-containing diguanylate cyclase [Sphingobium lignivorans]|uniref:diguanylate cyclase n=1 Tax=Sphingobium lignivorans TaxID=2735886 RepID=A0ABR6NCS2_9SPHN|nr:sensor domain-containing diguanylate cyclase [Sphingobium lignivorans]MBB5985077.1 diguanylate cyclase (GGDEF)-like protein [Sphingobium lignivorans]